MKSTTARGREFEAEVAELFRRAGFQVISNPKAAKPRQSDLFVRDDDGTDFLIEAKNQIRKIDVSDIDALRARLDRMAAAIIGVIFTNSGLTKGAIEAIQTNRRREILVVIAEELEALRSGDQNIRSVIERKRTALRVQGEVWFGPIRSFEWENSRLPSSSIQFRIGNSANSYFEAKSGLGSALFALALPDPSWGSLAGEGARLAIDLGLNSVRDLRDILGFLHEKFGLSENGMYLISQTQCSWCGCGAADFVKTVGEWPKRYAKSGAKVFHHSEEFRYFDEFRDGWLELSAQQRIDFDNPKRSMLYHSELVIQLPGIPIDTSPFLKLCRYVGSQFASFQYVGQQLSYTRRLKKRLPLRTVGIAVKSYDIAGSEPVVIGVVAKNPFYGKILPNELDQLDIPVTELSETELLLCYLRDWHDRPDLIDRYELEGLQVTLGGRGIIIRPFGTWNKMLKRSRQR